MHVIQQDSAVRIMGIQLRTSDDEAMHSIPPHWHRFTFVADCGCYRANGEIDILVGLQDGKRT